MHATDATVLLDAYAAKTCLYALHLDRTAPSEERLARSEEAEARIAAGVAFETLVGERLRTLFAGAADLSVGDLVMLPVGRIREEDEEGWSADRAARLAGTLRAIASGAAVIWNPRLPPVERAHRSGEPDALVRVGSPDDACYLPVDVKAHHALTRSARTGGEPLEALLSGPPASGSPPSHAAHEEDLLQLAHYWRMLEGIGRTPPGEPRGAIVGWGGRIDLEPIVGWFDLTAVLGAYDTRFADALDVVERALEIAAGAPLEPLGQPWYTDACHECPWRGRCGPELIAAGHPSLVRPRRSIRPEIEGIGVSTIGALANIDPATPRPDGRPVGESAAWREAIGRARLAHAGEPTPFALLREVGGDPELAPRIWRRPDAPESWSLSRRAVELDVDMENTSAGAYLWGTLLTYPDPTATIAGVPPGYRGFGDGFPPPGPAAVTEALLGFLRFVEDLAARAEDAGLSFGIFSYSARSAENPALRRAATIARTAPGGADAPERVERLLASPAWIDLYDEVSARVVSLSGLGLKVVARATGFSWRAEDAGGEASMRWYERATGDLDPDVRRAFSTKLLEYNADDVAATAHLREWFSHHRPEEVAPVP
jgi:predicted RecB family nuclease